MNIKALITALVIAGSSSVAMARPAPSIAMQTIGVSAQVDASVNFGFNSHAQPAQRPYQQPQTVVVRDHRTDSRNDWNQSVVVRDHRTEVRNEWNGRDPYQPEYQPRFQVLDSKLQYSGTEYRKDIMLGLGAGSFSTLQLQGDSGNSYILKVVVEFADGTSQQQMDLNKTLRAGETMNLDLAGNSHTITRVMVYRADGSIGRLGNYNGSFSVLAK